MNSVAELDREEAALRLAAEVEALLTRFSEGLDLFQPVRAALDDFRETRA